MTHEAGKGDKRRPYDKAAWDTGYDAIFKKPCKNMTDEELTDETTYEQYEQLRLVDSLKGEAP